MPKKEAKPRTRDEIKADTEAFLAAGGVINKIADGVSNSPDLPKAWRNKRREYEDRQKRIAGCLEVYCVACSAHAGTRVTSQWSAR